MSSPNIFHRSPSNRIASRKRPCRGVAFPITQASRSRRMTALRANTGLSSYARNAARRRGPKRPRGDAGAATLMAPFGMAGVRFDHLIYEVFQQIASTAGDQKIVVYKGNPRWAHGLSNDHHNMTISRLMTMGPRRHQRWQRTIYP